MITQENIPYTADEIKAMVKTCEKYYKALERARQFSEHPLQEDSADIVEYIFPELQGNNDERIRKWLIGYFQQYRIDGMEVVYANSLKVDDILAWLEKQKEKTNPYSGMSFEYNGHIWGMCARDNGVDILLDKQLFKHLEKQGEKDPRIGCTDDKGCVTCENGNLQEIKIGQKFKVGDWITTTDEEGNVTTEKIIEFWGDKVRLIDTNGFYTLWPKHELNYYHLWTVQDAKDGDVLCTYECDKPKTVFILKGAPKKGYALSYHCYYNIMYPHFDSDSENGCLAPKDENVKPATKEQRDLLFSKMKQAGYEWNVEKKELKEIEQKPVDKVGPNFKAGDWV